MDQMETTPLAGEAARLWTQARVERLVGLWNQRLSTARIARALGPEVSRSAVVGKLMRMGLRRSDEQRHDAQAAGACHSRARLRPPILPPVPLPPPTPCAVVPRLTGILELGRSHCRWPYHLGDEIRFCGHGAASQGPYCPAHRAIAYSAVLPPLTLEALEAADPHPAARGQVGRIR
jgi:GcrA cell cycle regulator